jgi:hypothetical protein
LGARRGERSELEAALALYASVEPREGLEQRVLANLRGEREAVRGGWARWWLAGTAVAMVVGTVGAGIVLRNVPDRGIFAVSHRVPPQIRVLRHEEIDIHFPTIPMEKPAERPKATVREKGSRAHAEGEHPAILAAEPKLEQFPSPRPLSEQEKILASYVERYPETAELVAKARAAASLRDSLEESAEASKRGSE